MRPSEARLTRYGTAIAEAADKPAQVFELQMLPMQWLYRSRTKSFWSAWFLGENVTIASIVA